MPTGYNKKPSPSSLNQDWTTPLGQAMAKNDLRRLFGAVSAPGIQHQNVNAEYEAKLGAWSQSWAWESELWSQSWAWESELWSQSWGIERAHTHQDEDSGGTLNAAAIAAGTLPVVRGGTGVTTSTGTGNTVLSASPTFSGTVTFGNGALASGGVVRGILEQLGQSVQLTAGGLLSTAYDNVTVLANSGAADDLDTIVSGNAGVRLPLWLFARYGQTITVRHNQSPGSDRNIILAGAVSAVLDGTVVAAGKSHDVLMLFHNGIEWIEALRSIGV